MRVLDEQFDKENDMARTLGQVYMDPVFNALDPNKKHFLEARMIPPMLNPFAHHFINVFALVLRGLPHLKAVPAFQMMLDDFRNGRYEDKHTIVVPSSGNTAHAVARLARAFGFTDVKVVMAADVPESKKGILSALSSVEIIEVGGGKSVAARAIEEAGKSGHYYLDQYSHLGNMLAHELHTGPEVSRVLDENIGVFAAAMGSCGTVAGVGKFLKDQNPETVIVGVCPTPSEAVPGARNLQKIADVVTLPWGKVVDEVVQISRKNAFIAMRELWSVVEPQPGPTSGLAWAGLMQYLGSLNEHDLEKLRGTNAAFICPDDGRFYPERTTGELETGQGVFRV